jgi:sugar phosphate isomerase/epimerase
MAAGWALKLAATNGFVSDSRPIHVFTKCLQFLDFHQLAEVLGRIGFDGADLSVRKGGQILPEKVESELSKWVNELKKTGVRCNMIVTGINNPNDKFTEPVLKSMSKLGIRHYRMGYLEYDSKLSIPQNLENHKLTFENLEKLNRKYNVTGNYQNHSGKRVGGPVWDLYHILKDRDPQFIGVQYDVRHATVEGGESWPIGMKLLAPWIKTTDIKDFIWEKDKSGVWKVKNVPLGEGMVNFNIYLGLVKELNIEGPVSIHYEYDLGGAEHGNVNPAMGLPQIEGFLSKDLSYLRNRFEKYGL